VSLPGPKLDPTRPRQRWVVRRDLRFVDALLLAGSTLDEVHEDELGAFDRESIRRRRRRLDAEGRTTREVVVLFNGIPRFVEVGPDVQLHLGPPAGTLRRRLRREPDDGG
jgi:hypothetical protein